MTTERIPHIIRYSLEKLIARGGQGEVWRGVDQRLGRTVAVKILNIDAISVEKRRTFAGAFAEKGA
jgi:serine/threonine protein kinase